MASTTNTLFTSCPQDVLEHIIAWLPKGAPLRAVQLSCSSLRAAFMNIEPTFDNLEVIVAHRVETVRCNCVSRGEELEQQLNLREKLLVAASELDNDARSTLAPFVDEVEHHQKRKAELVDSVRAEHAKAQEKLNLLNKMEVCELMAICNPPGPMRIAAELVVCVFNLQRHPSSSDCWAPFRQFAAQPRFVAIVHDYDVATPLPERKLREMKKLIDAPQCPTDISAVEKKNGKLTGALLVWSRSVLDNAHATREAAPCIAKLDALTAPCRALEAQAVELRRVGQSLFPLQREGSERMEAHYRAFIYAESGEVVARCSHLLEELLQRHATWDLAQSSARIALDDSEERSRAAINDSSLSQGSCEVLLLQLLSSEIHDRLEVLGEESSARMQAFPRPPTKKELRNLRPHVKGSTWTPPPSVVAGSAAGSRKQPAHLQKLLSKQRK